MSVYELIIEAPDAGIGFTVVGTPAPQGSKRGFPIRRGGQLTGKVAMVESSKAVKPWREDVRAEAAKHVVGTFEGPVAVGLVFRLARPKSVSVKRRPFPWVKPDLDKLVRSTLDALKSAGVYTDDACVVDLSVVKRYADYGLPGADITITEIVG